MRKEPKGDGVKSFKIAHQTLCITAFNFERQSLIGYVELQVHPLRFDLRRIKLNSKQCRIYRVSINDLWEAQFSYDDPSLAVCQGDIKQRNLDFFQNSHSAAVSAVDSAVGNGELTIALPPEALPIIGELKPFRVTIEFSLEEPRGGIKFVVPDMDGTMLDRGAHLFTFGYQNSSRLWFPCLDNYADVCTWKLELTVDMYMTAVSVGDLMETVYTADLRKKTYHYYLSMPTAAPNIALAVGPFEVLVDPHMHEVTHFCLPHLMPILKQSTSLLHQAFEFYEELMSSRYPYSCYKQVFVDQAYCDAMSYATLTIFSTNLLFTRKIIEQVPVSRMHMAQAVAEQFFGCFISMSSWSDAWLPKGIAIYLAGLYRKKAFGNNDYRKYISEQLDEVIYHEKNVGGVVLDPTNLRDNSLHFSVKQPYTVSSKHLDIFVKKAHLIIRMLEIRVGRELLLQSFNKLLALATTAASQKFTSNTWSNMLLSTTSFLKGLATVTGKDINDFLEQWVHKPGVARFTGSFIFNRKRNVVELDLRQDYTGKGSLKYVGPLTVAIQELDGTFNHTFKIEENKTKFEITCHSKSRRQKNKKIPLCTGEEVNMDLNAMDPDSPVLWLRIDPDMNILSDIELEQQDFMWQYMLRYERCAVAQCRAIRKLETFPTPATRLTLTDTIENEHSFYQVRIEAAHCLAKVANAMVQNWAGPPAMIMIFRKLFGSHSCPNIVRQNNFNNLQHYFIQKAIPLAMAQLRTIHNICPPEVLKFLLDLLKYNDNSKNSKYSDNYYRSSMIDCLARTITPAVTTVTITGGVPSTDLLMPDTGLIVEEITRCLNLEKLIPSYHLTLTVSSLAAIRHLQKNGHLPSDQTIFKSYAVPGNFTPVRLQALEALVDYTRVDESYETLNWLLDLVEEDPEPYVRHRVMRMLIDNPPFTKGEQDSPLSSENLVNRLWRLMNSTFSHDSRLRCDIADMYFTLYGRNRPSCIPIPDSLVVLNLKERTTLVNPSMLEEDDDEDEYYIKSETVTHSSDSRGVKRKATESPTFGEYTPLTRPSSVDQSMSGKPDDSNKYKLKIRFGNSSTDAVKIEESSSFMQPPSQLPDDIFAQTSNSPKESKLSYEEEFLQFAGVQGTTLEGEPVPVPQAVTEIKLETQDVPKHSDTSMSLPGSQDSTLQGPVAFDSSMFPSESSQLEDVSSSKKKKKKKNKKHKKHKHRQHDRDEREHSSKSGSVIPTSGIILTEPFSSGASNQTSPTRNAPSSPDFEVI